MPVWVALDAGLFKKNGLNVEMTVINGGPGVALPATQKGDYDVWLGGMDSYIVYCSRQPNPCPLTAIASASHVTASGIYAPADSPIKSTADFKGKTVGVPNKGSQTDYVVNAWLKKNNLKPQTDVGVRSMGQTTAIVAALQNKQIDAGALLLVESINVMKQGMKQLVDFDKEIVPYETTQTIVRRDMVQRQRAVLLSYLKSVYEGLDMARSDRQKAIASAAKYAGLTDPEVLNASWNGIGPGLNTRPFHTTEGVSTILATLLGLPAQDYDIRVRPDARPEEFYTDDLLQELDKSGFFDQIDKQYGLTR